MLALEETRWTLNAFRIFSLLNILPIGVDVKSGKIQRQSSKRRVFIWKTLFGICIFHWVFMFARLIQTTVVEPEKYFRWDRFILHFACAVVAAVFYYTAFLLFVRNVEETVIIFNQLFKQREDPVQKMMDRQLQIQMPPISKSEQGNKTRGKSGAATRLESTSKHRSARGPHEEIEMDVLENQSRFESLSGIQARPRPLLTWPLQYSLDELIAKFLPVTTVVSGFCNILIICSDPHRPQLFFSVLPPEYQNPWSFLLLVPVEALWVAIFLLTLSFSIVVQVLFFGKCQLEFKRLSLQLRNLEEKFQNGAQNGVGQIRTEVWILRQILEEMQELVVLIELFNRCFPFCIFAWKLNGLSLCTMFYFFVIRHFQDFPLLAGFLGYLAILSTLLYTIMYGHAFSIPGKMDDLKNEFLLTAQKTTTGSSSTADGNWNQRSHGLFWTEMKRQVKRIHGVGVKVGSFNQMERESTPAFIDYVVNQVVSLLVTIPA